MGHDIDIINIKTREKISKTYITGNFTKYQDKYPGIHTIHGHKNRTVIKILRSTLDKMLDNGIVPGVHNAGSRALTFGVPDDPQKDIECYAACLQDFLYLAIDIEKEKDRENIYWYSDQVFKVTRFCDDKNNESDGEENESESED